LTIWKKALSVGTSAALLASLLITAAAPAALASITQTSAGNVAQGGTSANTATFLFTENSVNALTTVPPTQHLYVTICDPLDAGVGVCTSPLTVSWAGTPVISAPGSLGASVSTVGNVLDIKITGQDPTTVETIAITGLKVKALSSANPGAVKAWLTDSTSGTTYAAFVSATATATGKLAQAYGIGATSFIVANDLGSCPFIGTNSVTVGTETRAITSVSGPGVPVAGQQTFTIPAPGFLNNHLANEVVSQTVPNCNPAALGAPATVVRAATYTYSGTPTVYPGENNAPAGDLRVIEPVAGFLAKGTTLTFTITTAGVVFSSVPKVVTAGDIGVSAGVLSADRKTVVVTVTTASTVLSQVWLGNTPSNPVLYDVATTAAAGSYVDVSLALSGGLLTDVSTASNAIIFRGITATAPTPTVYIGENNQATGLVTLTEQAAGFFNAGLGANNVLAVCQTGVSYTYTFAPWAKVTAGDLKLRDGSTASATNIVAGTWDGAGCYTWKVWSASTVASTIVIGNSTFSSGPLINVSVAQNPGVVAMIVKSGGTSYNYDDYTIATVPFAVAVYRTSVAVTALSQPLIPAGATDVKVGDIQVAETANGQLKANEFICVEVLPRAGTSSIFAIQDTFLKSILSVADLPTATASGGLVVGPVVQSQQGCGLQETFPLPQVPFGYIKSFRFPILQQSTSGAGKVVIGNMHVATTADAVSGPVLFNVWGLGGAPTVVQFQTTVSPAKIGAKAKLSIGAVSALGLNPTSGYTSATPKVQTAGKYITWKFTGGTALAGQRVNILVAVRVNGAWGGPQYLASRTADANGIVTFFWKSTTGTVLNVRAQWPGNANFAVSTSAALGAHWR
jgi:hypothetical protein